MSRKKKPSRPAAHKPAQQGQGAKSMTQITALKAEDMGGEEPRNGGSGGATYGPDRIQQVGHRRHLNVTPTPDSHDAGDPNLIRQGVGNGKVPKVVWRWGRYVDDTRVFNSRGGEGQLYERQNENDHWSLESYERKNDSDTSGPGLTPVLLLDEAFGPGTTKCFAFACIEAKFNEGLDVESNEITWLAD